MSDLFCSVSFLVVVVILVIVANSKTTKKSKRKGSGIIYIYKLMDGRKAFYVGQTTDPDRRLSQHINDWTGNNKSMYIGNMWREPRMEIICKTNNQVKANKLENQYMRMWGRTNMKSA